MIERDIDVQANGNQLTGTLCLPSEKGLFPVVLMVHGSGPLDRNQNMNGQKLEIFNTFAHHLVNNGIASVRFDKRGCGSSKGEYYTAGHHDFVDDVVCWYESLHRAEFCQSGQLFLLGHSEGCLVSAHASLRQSGIAGLVLLCPFIEPMEDALIRQAHQIEREIAVRKGVGGLVNTFTSWLVGGPVANQRSLIRKIKVSKKPSIRIWFHRIPAKWFRELLSIEASQVFCRITCPMLLIAGEKDLQCNPADVFQIAALGKGQVDQRIIAGMTHVLRRDNQPASLFGTQRLIGQPVDFELLEVVADWLKSQTASEEASPLTSDAVPNQPI